MFFNLLVVEYLSMGECLSHQNHHISPSVPVQTWKLSFRYKKPSKKLSRVPTRLRHRYIILMSASVVIFKVLNEH